MPELPEVETIARGLSGPLAGRVIERADVRWERSTGEDGASFHAKVECRAFEAVHRRGKLILCRLSGDMNLAVHLKMSGRFFIAMAEAEPDNHVHVIFHLDDGSRLFFRDVRKFGYCRAMTGEDLARWQFLETLGPEPLEIDPEAFADLFRGRKARIKGLLLDQTFLAGVGNIYADESLFAAGIHPAAMASRVSRKRLKKLHGCLAEVLERAIRENGSSISDYRDAQGNAGAFQNSFRVYGKAGEPCPKCRSTFGKCKVAGRTTTFCTCCQPR
jgi:formamidopyrimidine-DNA glycosylase